MVSFWNQMTILELAELFAEADDHYSHILWIGLCGEIHLTPLAKDYSPRRFDAEHRGLVRHRFEVIAGGCGFFGTLIIDEFLLELHRVLETYTLTPSSPTKERVVMY